MTVTYSDSSFKGLLFRWKGSIWKSVYIELLIFLASYFTINLSYRFAMNEEQKLSFERIVRFVYTWTNFIPLQFLLGFFVSYIVSRWWSQLMHIGWPDKFLLFLSANLPGNDLETKTLRRTIARWTILHAVLVWKEISVKIKKRFPTDDHVRRAGLITDEEYEVYKSTTSIYGRWFIPISWIVNHLSKLNHQGIISDVGLQKLIEELYVFRSANGMLTVYDWINAPLRYTQVATFATYAYFIICLVGRQSIRDKQSANMVDIYFPFVTVLEFIFYVGWLKVAEEYRVPFGEDDDDFDMNYILDRDFHVSNMLVDELAVQMPKPVRDRYWGVRCPRFPHTKASLPVADEIPNWRLYNYKVPEDLQKISDESQSDISYVQIIDESAMPPKARFDSIMGLGPPSARTTDPEGYPLVGQKTC